MKFFPKRRRQAPTIIIISLIDVLIVLVAFLLVSTTYRRQPAVKISLPESQQGSAQELKPGVSDEVLVVTVRRELPNFYVGTRPVTSDRLQAEFEEVAKQNKNLSLELNADEGAGIGLVLKVYDAAKAARVKNIKIRTKSTKR